MAVPIGQGRTFGPGLGGGEGWIASRRAGNEKIQPKRDPHGAKSDKDTLRTERKGSSYEEARTNGPIKCDLGLNGTTPPPPPYAGGMGTNPTPRGEGRNGRGTSKPYP